MTVLLIVTDNDFVLQYIPWSEGVYTFKILSQHLNWKKHLTAFARHFLGFFVAFSWYFVFIYLLGIYFRIRLVLPLSQHLTQYITPRSEVIYGSRIMLSITVMISEMQSRYWFLILLFDNDVLICRIKVIHLNNVIGVISVSK